MSYQRINKLLSHYGICSRREAERLIKDKRVLVNGLEAELGMKVDPEIDKIIVNEELVQNLNFKSELLLLNKPKFVITSCSDNFERTTIIDLLPNKYKKGFFPIGRLDYLSRGALLITNNGSLCYKLSHPKFEHKKTYLVEINGELKEKKIDMWRSGIELKGKKTYPCSIKIIKARKNNFTLRIELKEGRNRQIRNVARLLSYKVTDLKRISFGEISLGNLEEGCWKLLNESQFKYLI